MRDGMWILIWTLMTKGMFFGPPVHLYCFLRALLTTYRLNRKPLSSRVKREIVEPDLKDLVCAPYQAD